MVTNSDRFMSDISLSEIQKVRIGDYFAIQKYCNVVEPVIRRIARRFSANNMHRFDELVQEGRLTAINAANHWCPERGRIEPYVIRSIRNGMLYFCRSEHRVQSYAMIESSIPRQFEDQKGILNYVAVDGEYSTVDDEDALPVIKEAIQRWLKQLPAKKRQVIELVYFQGLNQSSAAERLGITRSRVGQIIQEIFTHAKIALVDVTYLN
jgi:RNA polymerase sigma factor (sigma-70 family)